MSTLSRVQVKEVMVDKELYAIKQQETRIAALKFKIAGLKYNQVKINAIISQQEITMLK